MTLLGLLAGGGSEAELPEWAVVDGTVTYNGKPLDGGTVTFYPQDGKGNPAFGDIQSHGTFQLSTYETHDGAVLGKHKVTVEVFSGQGGRL